MIEVQVAMDEKVSKPHRASQAFRERRLDDPGGAERRQSIRIGFRSGRAARGKDVQSDVRATLSEQLGIALSSILNDFVGDERFPTTPLKISEDAERALHGSQPAADQNGVNGQSDLRAIA